MSFFVARQPIFDRKLNVYGYELLYREGFENFYSKPLDGDKATSNVLTSSFMVFGIDEITNDKKAFINFTENYILKEIPTVFNKEILVVEIIEQIEPIDEIIKSCQNIKNQGYMIALDDFVFAPKYIPFLKLADIIKVDFQNTDHQTRIKLSLIAKEFSTDLLAEKVETREEYKEAKKYNYKYFQGYFFSKPKTIKTNALPIYSITYFKALTEVNKTETNIKKLAEIIKKDVSLSYKLLRLINSAAFGMRNKIESINQALTFLGLKEIQKWLSLIIVKEIAEKKDLEAVRCSLIRARFLELLAPDIGLKESQGKLFMLGLFSLIDVVLKRDLKNILNELPIDDQIKFALLGNKGIYYNLIELIRAYEKADWTKLSMLIKEINLNEDEIAELYLKSVVWSDKIISLN